jgi:hypothetical protein
MLGFYNSSSFVCCPVVLQVRITGGIQQLLPSFLPGLLFGPPVPLERLVLDDERGILYSLAANNALQVRGWACVLVSVLFAWMDCCCAA